MIMDVCESVSPWLCVNKCVMRTFNIFTDSTYSMRVKEFFSCGFWSTSNVELVF